MARRAGVLRRVRRLVVARPAPPRRDRPRRGAPPRGPPDPPELWPGEPRPGARAPLAVQVLATVVLGGVVTCALGYLLIERINRENMPLALSIGPPPRPVGPGVVARLLLTWAIGAGVFLLAITALAIAVLAAPGATT